MVQRLSAGIHQKKRRNADLQMELIPTRHKQGTIPMCNLEIEINN